jgi:hypothetical protein
MIEFSQCRVSWDGKYLYITAGIQNLDYFTNVYIDKVSVDTQDTFTSSGPSSTPAYTYTSQGNQKSVSLALEYRDLGINLLKDKMLFIWVTAKGTPTADTPCGMDTSYKLCVAFNESLIFSRGLSFIKELSSSCQVPSNMESWALLNSAFRLALDSGEYSTAIDLWNKLVKGSTITSATKNCGCNG